MNRLSLKRIFLTIAAVVAVLLPLLFSPSDAPVQAQGNPIVGAWAMVENDPQGGVLHTWFIFGSDRSYKMVSIYQGGPHAGSETQRWGTYQWQPTGQNQGNAFINVTGGAPQQVCSQGAGCTPVRNIQGQMKYQLQVQGDQMRNGTAVLRRGQVPQQLMAQLPETRTIQGPVAPQGGRYQTPGRNPANGEVTKIPGLGRNCDDLQQQRVCQAGNGGYYTKNQQTGCMVCVQ